MLAEKFRMANKLQERIYVEWFLKEKGFDYQLLEDADPPDFFLTLQKKRIGVEVTNIFNEPNSGRKGSKSKRQESHRIQWLQKLSLDYYQKCEIPIAVKILLPCSEELQIDTSCDVLEALFKNSELDDWEHKVHILDCDRRIIEVFVQRLPKKFIFKGYSRWTCINDHMGWVAPVSKDHIAHALREKEKKLDTYRLDCDGVWLLAVIDRSWKSGQLNFDGNVLPIQETLFDSVWLLEYPIKIHELFC